MILYEGRCKPCNLIFDDVMSVAEFTASGLVCPDCAKPAERFYGQPPGISGPLPSKPLVIKHAGLSFTSQSQVKQYQRENPNARMMTKDDAHWRKHHDGVRAKAERRARARGYTDFEDQWRTQKREQERKKQLGS